MIKWLLILLPFAAQSQRIEAESFLNMKGITINTGASGKYVGSIETGDWVEYNISVPVTGSYNIQLRVATPYAGARLTIGGVVMNLPQTGNLNTYTTVTANVPLVQGAQTLRVTSNSYRWNFDWLEIGPPPYLKPVANAGRDTIIYFPVDSYLLTGVYANGTPSWAGPNLEEQTATRLYKGTYQYILTVTGPGGIARDTINVTAEWHPDKIYTFIDGGVFGKYAVTNNGQVYIIMGNAQR